MKVAITIDWLTEFGGAERVLTHLHEMYPDAPIYTSLLWPSAIPEYMRNWDIRTSFLQKIPLARSHHRALLPLMPLAFEQFDMSEYDVVLTTAHACAKGVITGPDTTNICYIFTPPRYLWEQYYAYTNGSRRKVLYAPIANWLRVWDRVAADRVDHFIAISGAVADRVWRHYRREADVIFPPVDTDRFTPNGAAPEDFYLVVARLVPYKRIDLAIAAANRLGRRLWIVGDGPERRRLKAMAGPTVRFLGCVPDEELARLYARCRAFLFPSLDDFGVAPVEAQAAGRPVIALGRGAAVETVVPDATGMLFDEQQVDSMVEAIERFERLAFDPAACRRNAERFDSRIFRERFRAAVETQVRLAADRKRGRRLGSRTQTAEPLDAARQAAGPDAAT
jgi:glycosyltransferase involved in cell wall biosynthesis